MLAGIVCFSLLRRKKKCSEVPVSLLVFFFFLWAHDQWLLFLDFMSRGNNYLEGIVLKSCVLEGFIDFIYKSVVFLLFSFHC